LQYKSIKKALIQSGNQQHITPARGNNAMSGKPEPKTVEDAVLQEMGFD